MRQHVKRIRYMNWFVVTYTQCCYVAGTPLHVVVDEVDKGYVTAYGQGLSLGLSGKECTFHVVGPSSEYSRRVQKRDKIKLRSERSRRVRFTPPCSWVAYG